MTTARPMDLGVSWTATAGSRSGGPAGHWRPPRPAGFMSPRRRGGDDRRRPPDDPRRDPACSPSLEGGADRERVEGPPTLRASALSKVFNGVTPRSPVGLHDLNCVQGLPRRWWLLARPAISTATSRSSRPTRASRVTDPVIHRHGSTAGAVRLERLAASSTHDDPAHRPIPPARLFGGIGVLFIAVGRSSAPTWRAADPARIDAPAVAARGASSSSASSCSRSGWSAR